MVVVFFSIRQLLIVCKHLIISNEFNIQYKIFVIQNEVQNTGKIYFLRIFIDFLLSSTFSVIHPEEYEKRLLKFLFEKVFINSNQTLEELLASPILPPQEDDSTSQQRESFEVIQTTDVLQNLSMQPLTTPDVDSTFIESTAL